MKVLSFLFCQKQDNYILMTLLNINFWKTEKTAQMHQWNPVGMLSIAAVEQSLGTDAVQHLCPYGVKGLSNALLTPLSIHTLILRTPVSYRGTWNKFISCFFFFFQNSILRKRLNLFNAASPPIPLQAFSISSVMFTGFVGVSLY